MNEIVHNETKQQLGEDTSHGDGGFRLFNFQQYINNIRFGRQADEIKAVLDAITDDTAIEDTPFYKDYLSLFFVEKAFDGFELLTNPKLDATYDDYIVLIRLIVASPANDFSVTFDQENKTVTFSLLVTKDGETIVRPLQEFNFVIAIRLMEIYLRDQIRFEAMLADPAEKENIERLRFMMKKRFDEKIKEARRAAGCCID